MPEQSTRKRNRRKVTVKDTRNAEGISPGDVVTIIPGDDFTDGDLVAFQDYYTVTVRYLYHCKGKTYAYFSKSCQRGANRTMHDKRDVKILGVVADQPKAKPAPKIEREEYNANFEWPAFGIHRNDTLIVEKGGTPEVNKIVLVRELDGRVVFARVCMVKANGVIRAAGYRGDAENYPPERVIGVAVKTRHDGCRMGEINALRAKLEKLRNEDEQWANVTRCFEIEKEIYDLERPLDEEEETDDTDDILSAEVIGGGER
jgi:SOS-response transcriptional repressor LexA